jgi:hypothetical protein
MFICRKGVTAAGTNFPPELYDGHLFGKESYYDELAKVQKAEMDRREKVSPYFSPASRFAKFRNLFCFFRAKNVYLF